MEAIEIPRDHPDHGRILAAINNRKCPDCGHVGFTDGPKNGEATRAVFCDGCGAGFIIAPWPTAFQVLRRIVP